MISEPLISFFKDRIEIFSHGGLPSGLSKEQFLDGVSKPRNSTLMRKKKVIELLLLNSNENALTLSNQIGVVKRTVERALKSLQNKGYIERHGSKRDGSWIVKK